MARKTKGSGSKCQPDQLRVNLIQYFDDKEDGQKRNETTRQIIGLMFANLASVGRRKRKNGSNSNAA